MQMFVVCLCGRHYKLLFMIQCNMHYITQFATNIDYIFILRENMFQQTIIQGYYRMFPNFDMFCQVMDQCNGKPGV